MKRSLVTAQKLRETLGRGPDNSGRAEKTPRKWGRGEQVQGKTEVPAAAGRRVGVLPLQEAEQP